MLLLLSVFFQLLCTAFACPTGGYLYRDCSICFSIQGARNFSDADEFCRFDGGALLEIRDTMDLTRLQRYLEGIQERRSIWVGYLYNGNNMRIAADGSPASSVILDDSNFVNGSNGGEDGICIGIEEGKLFSAPCFNLFPCICQHHYDVPRVQFSQESGSVFFITRDQYILRASVFGSMISSTEWREDNVIIAKDQSEFSMSAAAVGDGTHNVSLAFMNFNMSVNAGRYSLVVINPVGTFIVGTWQVQQAVLGMIVNPPSNLTVAMGQIAGFECGTIGFSPPFQVTWFKDSVEFRISSGDTQLFVTPETGTLFIRDVETLDAGSYHCTVNNAAGMLTSMTALLSVVTEPSSLGNFRIEEVISPRSQSIQVGQNFVMDALVRSSSSMDTKIAVSTLSTFSDTYTYPTDNGFPVFEVQNITVEQNGTFYFFQYISSPDFAMNKDKAVLLTVHAAASVDLLVTGWDGIQSFNKFQSIPRGRDVTIECHFSGIPTPSVEWFRDGVLINTGITNPTASLSILSLSNVKITSVYQCHVSNQHGSDTAMLLLCSQIPDGVPGSVEFQAISDTNSSLYVNWNEVVPINTSPELVRYHIWYRALSGGAVVTQTELFDVRSSVISGLLSNTEYEVCMSASSLIGSGATSTKTVTTFANVPTDPIPAADILMTYSQDNTAIMIEWSPFMESFPVVAYELQYRLTNQGEGAESTVKISGDTLVGVVTDLVNAKNYEARVRIQIQSQRDPVQFLFGPWSAYVQISGVFTTTTATSTTTPADKPVVYKGLPLSIIVPIVVGMVAFIAMVVGIVILICCCFYHRRPDGIYSIPETGTKASKAVSFEFSATSSVYMTENANTTTLSSQPVNEDVLTTSTSLSTEDAPSDSHNVNIAVVENSSVIVEKQPLLDSTEWIEEFDHLTNLVTLLEGTVSSIASLDQTSNSPDMTLQVAVSQSVVSQDGQGASSQSVASQDVPTVSSSQDNDTTSEDNNSSQIIQVGHAKHANHFVPEMYGKKKMTFTKNEEEMTKDAEKEEDKEMAVEVYDTNWAPSPYNTEPLPNYFLSSTSSPRSNVSIDSNEPKQTRTTSEENRDEINFDANFIELLQYGDPTDLSMV